MGSPTLRPSRPSNSSPLPNLIAFLPTYRLQKQNQRVLRRRAEGAVQMLGGGLGCREAPGGSGLREAAALAHSAIPVTRVALGHGSSRRTGSSSAVAVSQPRTRAPSSLWPSCLQKQSRGPVPALAAEVTVYSPQLFLSLRFLAMVVQGLVAVRRCHCARSSSGPRLQAVGGSVPAWAPFAQTPEMLLWRWWEGVGRRREEKTVDQAQHHKPKSTQTPASHPPCLGPPLEREDSD